MRQKGGSSRILSVMTLGAAVAGILLIGIIASAPAATASHLGTLEERRAEREAAREARRAAREAEDGAGKSACACSAGLTFSRPDIQWRGNTLTFLPRVDVDIRTRGEASDPSWSVGLNYSGTASFTSDDVTPPPAVSFTGSKHVAGGACGDNRYSVGGLALEPVAFGQLTRALVGSGQELAGLIRLQASVTGCSVEAESRQASFTVNEFGNLRLSGWRIAR